MSFKIYNDILSSDEIEEIINYTNNHCLSIEGKVGNRVNLKQKIRSDIFITNEKFLKKIDNIVYNNLYEKIKNDFGVDIKFREKWKVGLYDSINGGFYNLHTDDAGDTKYRKISCVIALSNKNDYEGGQFHIPSLNFEEKFEKGSAIIFNSELLHGVKIITKGRRYVLIGFMFNTEGKKIKEVLNQRININNYIPQLSDFKIEYSKDEKIDDFTKAQPIGDIDYSDQYKNPLWTDDDDYYYEDNSGDTLLVLFAGMGWKKSIPTFIFYNFLKEYKNIDKLFLRDITCRYYLTGLRNITKDLNSTIEFIRNLTSKKKYKKIVALGCSAGGYAAILYGHLLKFTNVTVFSPQVVLNNKKTDLIGDTYNAPKTCEFLKNKNPDDEFYQKCLDLKNFIPFDTKINIYYSERANNGADKKHALYLESENCKVIENSGNNHLLALELRDKGELKEIIDKLIE